MLDVVGIGRGGPVYRGFGQPVVGVVGEGIATPLHDVAGIVIAVVPGSGLEQPIARGVQAVVVALAVLDPARGVRRTRFHAPAM